MEVLFLVLIALVLSGVERVRRRRKVDVDLSAWAGRLGMARVGDELFGNLDEIPVGARLAFDTPHKTRVAARWTLFARIQPPLDLGIAISNRALPVELAGVGALVAESADPRFNARFTVTCDEPRRAGALLDARVCSTMLTQLHPNAMCMVTDGGVAVQTLHGLGDEHSLRLGLQAVAAIATAVNVAREGVPAALQLAGHEPAWRRFASDNGLQHIAAPLCMFGTIRDSTVYAYSVRKAVDDFDLEVWMRFEVPLGLGLLLQPMRTVDRMTEVFANIDHKLGDPLFDETFLVRVADEAGATLLLDAETRRRLLLIHDSVGPLSLTDDGLSVRLPVVPAEPSVVPKLVSQMLDIAQFVAERRQQQRHGSPYR